MVVARAGVFVTLEGVDGCGKSTKAKLLAADLRSVGYEVVIYRDPGSTGIAEQIRTILLDPANDAMADECELLLYEAARAQLVKEAILPALERGAVVLCDRFFDSTLAYQSAARGLSEDIVRTANELGSCGVVPNRTIVFDVDPARSYHHRPERVIDRLEAEGLAFQEKVRAGYLRMAQHDSARVRVVDGVGTVDEVYARLVLELVDLFPELQDIRGDD